MEIDLRIPLGMMFSMMGAVLSAFGLATRTRPDLYVKSLGINGDLVCMSIADGDAMGGGQQHIVDRAIMRTASQMGATIERHWQAISKHSSTVRYIGLVLRGEPDQLCR